MQIEKMETVEKEAVEQERYDRERSFHNWVFSEKGRASVNKFYSISDLSQNYYRERILSQGAHDVLEIGCGRGSVASFLIARRGLHRHRHFGRGRAGDG